MMFIAKNFQSILQTKPLKHVPKGVIYRPSGTNLYNLADVQKCKCVGEMIATTKPSIEYYNVSPFKNNVLHINSLEIDPEEQGKGWGTCLLNHAKRESYNRNCGGRLSLVAYYPGKSPHVFYKKNGLVAERKHINRYLDKCIKTNNIPSFMPAEKMYLPVKNLPTDALFSQKILRSLVKALDYLFYLFS